MRDLNRHLIPLGCDVRTALQQLDSLAKDAILFVVDDEGRIQGSLTDGDIRRGLIRGLQVDGPVNEFLRTDPKVLHKGNYDLADVIALREGDFKVVPVVDDAGRILNVINFRLQKSYLPLDAVIMAGGRGERLRPLTDDIPKPLLPVGGTPIMEHNVNRLSRYGVDDLWISVNYRGDQIREHFGDGATRSMRIQYIEERQPLGTAGSLALAEDLRHDTVLLMNSDLLTNIDFEDFFLFFRKEQADMAVACIPHKVTLPYAVMETRGTLVTGLREKPTYTYFANAGMYLMRREVIDLIPTGSPFNATDLMDAVIAKGGKVASYAFNGYWLDIGRHEDYVKAQEDVQNVIHIENQLL